MGSARGGPRSAAIPGSRMSSDATTTRDHAGPPGSYRNRHREAAGGRGRFRPTARGTKTTIASAGAADRELTTLSRVAIVGLLRASSLGGKVAPRTGGRGLWPELRYDAALAKIAKVAAQPRRRDGGRSGQPVVADRGLRPRDRKRHAISAVVPSASVATTCSRRPGPAVRGARTEIRMRPEPAGEHAGAVRATAQVPSSPDPAGDPRQFTSVQRRVRRA